jgi:hypothetical protein
MSASGPTLGLTNAGRKQQTKKARPWRPPGFSLYVRLDPATEASAAPFLVLRRGGHTDLHAPHEIDTLGVEGKPSRPAAMHANSLEEDLHEGVTPLDVLAIPSGPSGSCTGG